MTTYHKNIICKECRQITPHKAHGLCPTCYHRKFLKIYYLSEENRERYRVWRLAYELREIKKQFIQSQTNHTA